MTDNSSLDALNCAETHIYSNQYPFLGSNRLIYCDSSIGVSSPIFSWQQFIIPWSFDLSGNITIRHPSSLNISIFVGKEIDLELTVCNNTNLPAPNDCSAYDSYSGKYTIINISGSGSGTEIECEPDPSNPVVPNKFSDNSNHFDSDWLKKQWSFTASCEPMNYYTNEILRFGYDLAYTGGGGFKVVGNPRLRISFSGINGTTYRYAELNRDFSSYASSGNGYFEFHYAVQSTDFGTIGVESVDSGEYDHIIAPGLGDSPCSYPLKFSFCTNSLCDNKAQAIVTNATVNADVEPSGKNSSQFTILMKRSSVADKAPTSSDLLLGELAVNTNDGKLFFKKEDNSIVTLSSTTFQTVTNLGSVSGNVNINYDPTKRPIFILSINGTATQFTKGSGWPSSSTSSIDVVLKITVSSATTITWSIVNEWYSQPPAGALSIGTHLFLLRSIGSSIVEGHYIGNKTN